MSAKLIHLIFFISILILAEGQAQGDAWDRTVYWDPRYRTSWTLNSQHLADAFELASYSVLNANQLKTWMNNRIADRKPSVVVFSQDVAPDTVVESKSPSCTLRRYLDAGGKIVWQADIPFYYQGHSNGSSTTWGTGGSTAILGFDASSGEWDTGTQVTFTAEGTAWGLTGTWRSYRPAVSMRSLRILATDGKGNAAAWVKHYLPDDTYRGFVRIFDRNGEPSFNDLLRVAEYIYIGMKASNPAPADGIIHTDVWVNLSWRAGDFAVSHDVYLGDSFEDVNNGAGDTFRGNQTDTFFVAGFPGFTYPEGLVSGTTYYWRIDEVKSDGTTTKGDVWSFTTVHAGGGIRVKLKYGGGTGEADDPYLIYTGRQMNEIGDNPEDWDKHFKLMADIDLSAFTGTDFNLIGYYRNENDREPFTGVFDGNGHTISNFSYRTWYMLITEGIGLFRYVGGTDMEIKDLGLIDPNVIAASGDCVGSLVGIMEYGAITNCYVQNGHISGNTWVGGLAGRIYVCTITDCYVEADVSGFTKIGGLVGENYAGLIKNCSSSSDVYGTSKIGGLVGVNEFLMEQGFYIPGNITGCCAEGEMEGLNCVGGLVGDNLGRVMDSYATADVFASFVFQIDGPPGGNRFGGLVGHNYYWTEALVPPSVLRCYSTGSITESFLGTANVGGLVGLNEGTVTNSFWDKETSGLSNSDGGTGKSTSQMQRRITFINAGWDFVDETANGTEDIWRISEGQDYPRLNWEIIEEQPQEVSDPLSEAMDTNLSFTTGGDADWFSQTITSYHDGDAAQSGDITDEQNSWIQTKVNGAGMVNFYWKASSEGNCDYLEFYIDGVRLDRISGSVDWFQMTFEITGPDKHTLEWRYTKDESIERGDDCCWVDKVEWVPAN